MHVTPNHIAMFVEKHGEYLVQNGALVELQWVMQ
jgi:hypothetical protein